MAYLAGITVYPIKSLDPVSIAQTRIVEGGGLEHDREFALFDAEGKYVNGKRNADIHLLRAAIDWKDGIVCLQTQARSRVFHLHRERARLEAWLSDYFSMPVSLRQNARGGFPDDTKAPGPTLIGQETLQEVASWYDGIPLAEIRARFRANLEIADAPPFWEDRLYGEPESVVRFRIGDVLFEGVNPCQRCIVPTRDTQSAQPSPEFAQIFRARREETLPYWANLTRFNHFYRLAVNTCVPETEIGKALRVGDQVEIL